MVELRKKFILTFLGRAAIALLALFFLANCTGASSQTQPEVDLTQVFESALLTATHAVQVPTQTSIPTLTFTPMPTPTPTLTPWVGPPPELPASYAASDWLRSGVTPHTYIEDTCQYLKMRWDPNNSPPGTVVMIMMYHSITEDYNPVSSDGSQIRHSDMVMMVEHAKELGFQTITTEQLVNFLETNARIPMRSMMIIVDDRRPGVVREHFWPYLVENNWTLTLGWLIGDTDSKPASPLNCCPDENFSSLWEQMEFYYAQGYLDIQSHGYIHNINADTNSTDEFLLHEMADSAQVLREHFYCKDHATGLPIPDCKTNQPMGYIWPGGGFTPHAAEIARQVGYRVGFTTNPRGPVMFNWIPLAEAYDPSTPSWLPEGGVGDPLMVLPRYWSIDAAYRLDDVANIGEEAMRQAEQTRQAELDYYNYYCRAITGEIPTLAP